MNPRVVEVKEKREGVRCDFCHKSTIDPLMFGPMYRLSDITIHYFCLLFSAGLSQNGEDDEGILGFLRDDVKQELKRGKKLKCKYCKLSQATVGCSVSSCKFSFHYPCGIENGVLFQFINNYESYCKKHRPEPVMPAPESTRTCPICYCDFKDEKYPIKPPCCNKDEVFHRKCMMETASKSGLHFFKCPLCNDKETFGKAMRLQGIYVPDRDAEWELEPGAFAELSEQYSRCDKQPCLCPSGREFSEDGEIQDWKIIRCGGCGAAGVHMKCEGLTVYTYRCETCTTILRTESNVGEESSQRRISRAQQIIDSESDDGNSLVNNFLDMIKPKTVVEGDDSDSDSSFTTSESSSCDRPAPNKNPGIPVIQRMKMGPKEYEYIPEDNDSCSELEDYDYPEETEADFIPTSAANNISSGNVELEEETCQKNDSQKVRTGLVEASQNRDISSMVDILARVCELNNVRPMTDRALRNLHPLPDMRPHDYVDTNNTNLHSEVFNSQILEQLRSVVAACKLNVPMKNDHTSQRTPRGSVNPAKKSPSVSPVAAQSDKSKKSVIDLELSSSSSISFKQSSNPCSSVTTKSAEYLIPKDAPKAPFNFATTVKPPSIVILEESGTKRKPTQSDVEYTGFISSPLKLNNTIPSRTKKAQSNLDKWLTPVAPEAADINNPFSSNVLRNRNISASPEVGCNSKGFPTKSPAICSPTATITNTQPDNKGRSSRSPKKTTYVATLDSDSDDDCKVVEIMPTSSRTNSYLSSLAENNSIITINDDEDDLKIEAGKQGTQSKPTSSPPTETSTGIPWHGSTTYKTLNLKNNNDLSTNPRKFFSGSSVTISLSAALIANAARPGNINSFKTNVQTKTNSGSGLHELVILDSDDEEEPQKTTNAIPQSPNSMTSSKPEVDDKPSGENDSMPIPNRSDLQCSSVPKRVRGISNASEDTDAADLGVADSKKFRVSK